LGTRENTHLDFTRVNSHNYSSKGSGKHRKTPKTITVDGSKKSSSNNDPNNSQTPSKKSSKFLSGKISGQISIIDSMISHRQTPLLKHELTDLSENSSEEGSSKQGSMNPKRWMTG